MIPTEPQELIIVFIVIMLDLIILVWLQRWSGLT